MNHPLLRFKTGQPEYKNIYHKESIDDIITLYNNEVYRKEGDTWMGENTYLLKPPIQLVIPFPEYNKIYEVQYESR